MNPCRFLLPLLLLAGLPLAVLAEQPSPTPAAQIDALVQQRCVAHPERCGAAKKHGEEMKQRCNEDAERCQKRLSRFADRAKDKPAPAPATPG